MKTARQEEISVALNPNSLRVISSIWIPASIWIPVLQLEKNNLAIESVGGQG
jgi:hypothetical protein